MRAAVIGAGVYGATIAVKLAEYGASVDLYDRHADILSGATANNCNRLHMGYHYPRTDVTGMAHDAELFERRFPGAVTTGDRHLYAVVMRDYGSKTTSGEYAKFLDYYQLPYRQAFTSLVRGHAIDLVVEVPEQSVNPDALREQLRAELGQLGVRVHLDTSMLAEDLDHDWIIRATYGQPAGRALRYEVCETAVVKLGPQWERTSCVVMDGPFCCVDPLPGTDLHLLYDVVHSVHASNVGYAPEVPEHLADVLDIGVVPFARYTYFPDMFNTASQYFGHFDPGYVGSRYTIRAVLPDVDATDERPTMVSQDGRVLSVVAGKLGGAVAAANQVADLVWGSMLE